MEKHVLDLQEQINRNRKLIKECRLTIKHTRKLKAELAELLKHSTGVLNKKPLEIPRQLFIIGP